MWLSCSVHLEIYLFDTYEAPFFFSSLYGCMYICRDVHDNNFTGNIPESFILSSYLQQLWVFPTQVWRKSWNSVFKLREPWWKGWILSDPNASAKICLISTFERLSVLLTPIFYAAIWVAISLKEGIRSTKPAPWLISKYSALVVIVSQEISGPMLLWTRQNSKHCKPLQTMYLMLNRNYLYHHLTCLGLRVRVYKL